MILAFLLGAAEPDPEFDRLFGPEPAPDAVEARLPESALPWWTPAAAVLTMGVGAMAWMYRRGHPAPAGLLSVLVRQSLGDRGALVLIEVTGADGERRRLLIGTGGGPPSLVADLGAGFEVPEAFSVPEVPQLALPPAVAPSSAPARQAPTTPPSARQAPTTSPPARQAPPPLRSVPPAGNIAEEILRDRRSRSGRLWAVVGEEE